MSENRTLYFQFGTRLEPASQDIEKCDPRFLRRAVFCSYSVKAGYSLS